VQIVSVMPQAAAKPVKVGFFGSAKAEAQTAVGIARPLMLSIRRPDTPGPVITNADVHQRIAAMVAPWMAPGDDEPYQLYLLNFQGTACGTCSNWFSSCAGCKLPKNSDPFEVSPAKISFKIVWNAARFDANKCPTPVRDASLTAAAGAAAATAGRGRDAGDEDVVVKLKDCMRAFGCQETLSKGNEWYCSKCKEHVCASKQMEVWRCPDTLIIHLKRFSFSRWGRDKLDTFVDFPIDGLDMSPWIGCENSKKNAIYDLYAVSNHSGGLGGGHYTAFGKNITDQAWYYFNDSSVSLVGGTFAGRPGKGKLVMYPFWSIDLFFTSSLQIQVVSRVRKPMFYSTHAGCSKSKAQRQHCS
jgi:hypothetical protein